MSDVAKNRVTDEVLKSRLYELEMDKKGGDGKALRKGDIVFGMHTSYVPALSVGKDRRTGEQTSNVQAVLMATSTPSSASLKGRKATDTNDED